MTPLNKASMQTALGTHSDKSFCTPARQPIKEFTLKRTVRQYETADVDGILAAWESASAVGHPFLHEDFLDQERYNIPNVYLPNAETWVIEQDGNVIGFISLIGNEVGAIFVDSTFHGTGAGKALMDKAQQLRGDLEVEVFKANAIGRQFYARYGFEPMSEKMHEETGNVLLRLRFESDNKSH